MKPKIYPARFDIRMTQDLYQAAKRYAYLSGKTLSELIRDLLYRELKNGKR